MINLITGIMLFILLKKHILNHNFDSLYILLALYLPPFLDTDILLFSTDTFVRNRDVLSNVLMVSSCCNASFADIRAQTEAHADHVSFQTSDCPGLRGECEQV